MVSDLLGIEIRGDRETAKKDQVREPKKLLRITILKNERAFLFRAQDLRKLAPLWLSKTEEMRADRAHWHLMGDVYGQGWISEMYGYAFGASEVRMQIMHCHFVWLVSSGSEISVRHGRLPLAEPLEVKRDLDIKGKGDTHNNLWLCIRQESFDLNVTTLVGCHDTDPPER